MSRFYWCWAKKTKRTLNVSAKVQSGSVRQILVIFEFHSGSVLISADRDAEHQADQRRLMGTPCRLAENGMTSVPGVKHDTAHLIFADSGCQCLQSAHLIAAQRCSGLDFYSNDSACAIFQNYVNFLSRSRAPVEKFRLSVTPSGLNAIPTANPWMIINHHVDDYPVFPACLSLSCSPAPIVNIVPLWNDIGSPPTAIRSKTIVAMLVIMATVFSLPGNRPRLMGFCRRYLQNPYSPTGSADVLPVGNISENLSLFHHSYSRTVFFIQSGQEMRYYIPVR
jgi:hypothetical protein